MSRTTESDEHGWYAPSEQHRRPQVLRCKRRPSAAWTMPGTDSPTRVIAKRGPCISSSRRLRAVLPLVAHHRLSRSCLASYPLPDRDKRQARFLGFRTIGRDSTRARARSCRSAGLEGGRASVIVMDRNPIPASRRTTRDVLRSAEVAATARWRSPTLARDSIPGPGFSAIWCSPAFSPPLGRAHQKKPPSQRVGPSESEPNARGPPAAGAPP